MAAIRLTFAGHLEELRWRILKSAAFMVLASCLFYNFTETILSSLAMQLGRPLVFISPPDAFLARIKLSVFGGLFLSSPFVIYQFWKFISLGLSREEKRYAAIFGPLSGLFFLSGAAFGYFIMLPMGTRFLLGFSTAFVVPMITVTKYVSFAATLTLISGAMFQLPWIAVFLTKLGIVTPEFLSSRRKYAIVIIFIISALFTPPDVITQCLMAVPLVALYEIGIIFSRFSSRIKP